jgi:hypothetical protein
MAAFRAIVKKGGGQVVASKPPFPSWTHPVEKGLDSALASHRPVPVLWGIATVSL